jgi:hypothetical protein
MLRIFLATAFLLAGGAVLADDAPRASVNYSKLADYQKRIDDLKDLDQLKVTARLGSKDAGVKPSDITLEAKLKSGQVVSIPIAADGAFTLPSSPELAREDPLFVSNQPKGTLGLDIKFDVKTPTVIAQPYAGLVRGAAQFNQAFKRQGTMASWFGPKAKGLLFAFTDGAHTLTLHTAKGDQVLKSGSLAEAQKHMKDLKLTDASGKSTFIYLPLDDDLLDENPQTAFDALPMGAIPAI